MLIRKQLSGSRTLNPNESSREKQGGAMYVTEEEKSAVKEEYKGAAGNCEPFDCRRNKSQPLVFEVPRAKHCHEAEGITVHEIN